jgi:hypothetical protein
MDDGEVEIRAVRFRQSGGVAGLLRGCDVAGAEIADIDRRALATHLDALGGSDAPARVPDEGMRDAIEYELTVDTTAGVRRLLLHDDAIPSELANLVHVLRARCRPVAS